MNKIFRRSLPFALFTLFLFAAHIYLQREQVFSRLMVYDDTIYFAANFFGFAEELPTNFLPYWLLRCAAIFHSIIVIKAASIMTLAIIGGVSAWIFSLFTERRVLAFFAAAVLSFFSVAPDQGFFVTGSHPSLGASFALISFALFLAALRQAGRGRDIALFVSAIAAFASSVSSPTTMLVAFVPLLWAATAQVALKPDWSRLRTVILVGWPILFHLVRGVGSFHYAKQDGWTEMSIENTIGNIGSFFSVATAPLYAAGSLASSLFALGVIVALAVTVLSVIKRDRSERMHYDFGKTTRGKMPFLVTAMLCAAIAGSAVAAPSLVVTSYLPRYAAPGVVFGLVLLGAPIVFLLDAASRQSVRFSLLAFAIFAGAGFYAGPKMRNDAFSEMMAGHRAIQRVVDDYADGWVENAQVVILLPQGLYSPTQGYNHWSTGYLRALTLRPDIIALAGDDTRVSMEPFITNWTSHGEVFWANNDGVTRRIQMKGLERTRPTYVYRVSLEKNSAETVTAVFLQDDGEFLLLRSGEILENVVGRSATNCTTDEGVFVWRTSGGKRLSPAGFEAATWRSRKFSGDESELISFAAAPGDHVRLSFRLRPDADISEKQAYSDTYPPMPLRAPILSVYHRYDGIHFASPGRPSVLAPTSREVMEFSVRGVEGCFYSLDIKGGDYTSLGLRTISGEWRFGRGFKKRFWRGELEWRLNTKSTH